MPIYSPLSGRDERKELYPPELIDLIDDSFIASFDLFDEYVARTALALFRTTGLDEACREARSAGEAVRRLGLEADIALVPVTWILSMLAGRQWITALADADGSARYLTPGNLPVLDSAEIVERQRAHDARCLPSYDIVALAAAHYPAVLQGRTTGEEALFGPEGIGPWVRYFSGDNPLYAVSNEIGAIAAARALSGEPGTVLEIGGGLGSGTASLLDEVERRGLSARVSSYCLTEISPLFLKRARRNLSAQPRPVALSYAELDIDREFAQDVVAPGSVALVYGVNVLHVARDLAATLAQVRKALRPGGMLVMAECVRPFHATPIPLEFVFNLLDSFRSPVLVEGWRPNGGFLTPEQWTVALAANGFGDIQIYPDIAAIRDAYPNFMVAAIVARRL
jgi:SAM-dependent methyltransferase